MKSVRNYLKRRCSLLAHAWGKLRWYTSRRGINQLVTNAQLAVKYHGKQVQCPFCGWRGSAFYPHSPPHERTNALCPRCKSKERHRLLYLYLVRTIGLLSRPMKILEIAPGPYSSYFSRDLPGSTYYTLDIESSLAAIKGDICALPFSQGAFDLIICYHVLEHVADDKSAIRELGRVLGTNGLLLLQVPIEGDTTREDPNATDPLDRVRLFGQEDHVRAYGRDFGNRILEAGLHFDEIDFATQMSSEDIQRYGLRCGEFTYVCHRSSWQL